jgi:Lipocalin-like domain
VGRWRRAAVLCNPIADAARAADTDDRGPFIGSWKLISYELTFTSGAVLKPFGDRPTGLILYQKDGHMSAQLMSAEAAPFADSDPLQATNDEAGGAWRGYIGYWGTFSVDTEKGVVTHHIEGGWFPNWIGKNQIRSFRFSDGELILEAHSPEWHARLAWRRIE